MERMTMKVRPLDFLVVIVATSIICALVFVCTPIYLDSLKTKKGLDAQSTFKEAMLNLENREYLGVVTVSKSLGSTVGSIMHTKSESVIIHHSLQEAKVGLKMYRISSFSDPTDFICTVDEGTFECHLEKTS